MRRSPHRAVATIALAAAVGSAAAAAPSVAAGPSAIGRVTAFSARFTTVARGASSGLKIEVAGAPPATGTAEPPAVREILDLPVGTRLDTRGAPRCRATDAQIAPHGVEAVCPAGSRIGEGTATGIVAGTTVSYHLGIYDLVGRFAFAAERGRTPLGQAFFGRVAGRTVTLDTPTLSGRIEPVGFTAAIAAHRRTGRSLVMTPERCPSSGTWTIVSTFRALSAVDGGAPFGPVQRRVARTPCR